MQNAAALRLSGWRPRREQYPQIRESDLLALGRGLARNSLRRELNKENPKLSATLDNGSRIAIRIPPASDGVAVTIRNYRERPFTVDELIERGTITRKAAQMVQEAIEQRRNILISGGNGTGKSTLLNTLAGAYIPRDRRVIVLEDAARDIKLPYHRNKQFSAVANTRPWQKRSLMHCGTRSSTSLWAKFAERKG